MVRAALALTLLTLACSSGRKDGSGDGSFDDGGGSDDGGTTLVDDTGSVEGTLTREDFDRTLAAVDAIYEAIAPLDEEEEVLAAVAALTEEWHEIDSYEATVDGTLAVSFSIGLTAGFPFVEEAVDPAMPFAPSSATQPPSATANGETFLLAVAPPDVIADALGGEAGATSHLAEVAAPLLQAGLRPADSSSALGEAVTVDFLSNLGEHRFVYLLTHGYGWGVFGTWIQTGEHLDADTLWDRVRALPKGVGEYGLWRTDSGTWITVGPEFFRQQDLDGVVIYLNACSTFATDILPNAMLEAGAAEVVGFSASAPARLAIDIAPDLVSALAEPDQTTSLAFTEPILSSGCFRGVGEDPWSADELNTVCVTRGAGCDAHSYGVSPEDCTNEGTYPLEIRAAVGSAVLKGGDEDLDGDGWTADQDCVDGDETVNPDGEETCNDLDDDCDGVVDNVTSAAEPPGLAEDCGWGGSEPQLPAELEDGAVVEGVGWSEWRPGIGADWAGSSAKRVISWYDTTAEGLYLATSSTGTEEILGFSTTQDIPTAVAALSDGTYAVAWWDGSAIELATGADGSWSIEAVVNVTYRVDDIELVANPEDDTLHLAASGEFGILWATSGSGDWSTSSLLSESPASHVALALDNDGRPVLAWSEWTVQVATQPCDGTSSFHVEEIPDSEAIVDLGIGLAIDQGGTIWLTWVDTAHLLVASRGYADSDWESSAVIAITSAETAAPSIGVSAHGIVGVALEVWGSGFKLFTGDHDGWAQATLGGSYDVYDSVGYDSVLAFAASTGCEIRLIYTVGDGSPGDIHEVRFGAW